MFLLYNNIHNATNIFRCRIISSYFVFEKRTQGFWCSTKLLHDRAPLCYANIKQCHLVEGICWNLIMVGWQIQSVLHEQSTLPLGRHTQWCIKPLCSYGTFNTGLKHQRFRTACSCKHIWNLPAIYTLVIYKNIFHLNP